MHTRVILFLKIGYIIGFWVGGEGAGAPKMMKEKQKNHVSDFDHPRTD